nr:hypothetical protein [Deltaproteobacteria bacterium]
MLVRAFVCPKCGASRETLEGALIITCVYCGGIIGIDTRHYWDPVKLAAGLDEGIRRSVRPTVFEARQKALGAVIYEAATRRDRARWRCASEEMYTLTAVNDPSQLGAMTVRDWVATGVAMAEAQEFDPAVKQLATDLAMSSVALQTTTDPIAAAREILEAGRRYARAFAALPEAALAMRDGGVEGYAIMMARNYVAGYEGTLGVGVAKRIYAEVFGDRITADARCKKCGAEIAGDLERCAFCGAVSEVRVDDPWLVSNLANWELVAHELVRKGQLDTIDPVRALLGFLRSHRERVAPEHLLEFVRRAIPWVSRERLHEGLAHWALMDDQLELIETLQR